MKTGSIWVTIVMALFLTPTVGQARSDEKSQKTTNKVQASPDDPDRQRHGSVAGTVVNKSGDIVGEANVELTDSVTEEPPLSVKTDKKGAYEFISLLPGVYSIQAKKNALVSDVVQIKITNASTVGPQLVLK